MIVFAGNHAGKIQEYRSGRGSHNFNLSKSIPEIQFTPSGQRLSSVIPLKVTFIL
jgi:hypothetical protein